VVPRLDDAAEYRFLTAPGSCVECRLVSMPDKEAELQLFGNRAGLLSLANVFLWFLANAWRREFLSLQELGFVRLDARLSVCMRLTDDKPDDGHGTILHRDRGQLLEWSITEAGLQQVALWIHRIVSAPGHEYVRLDMAPGSECGVHIRQTDVLVWLG
jgi:hypothetical protein